MGILKQRWCKKEGNKVLGKYLAHVNVTEPKEVLNIDKNPHFSFPETLFPSVLFTPPLPPIPISHHLSR